MSTEDLVDETIEVEEPSVREDINTWLDFKRDCGKINGNITIPNGDAIAGPNGSAFGFAPGGETLVSTQGDGAGWVYFRPNGFTNPEGQAILRNDGIFELSNSLNVKDAQIGIQHSVEAVFKSFNHNKGLYINQNNIGFYDWGKNQNLFCINSQYRTASIDVDKLFFGGYNLSDHGWAVLPNGLIVQWGYHHFLDKVNEGMFESTYSVRIPVSYPIAFPNKILSFSSTSERVAVFSSFADVTNSSCTLFATSMANANMSVRIRWIAIGY